MRAVCYPRVSSSAQRERNTVASQLRELPAFIATRGWELVRPVETYLDDGRTARAGKLAQRTGLARLLRDAAAKLFDVVVVVAIDRLTRAEDLAERGWILGALQHAGVRVADMSGEVMDLSTDHGDLVVSLKAYLAAAENRRRSQAVAAGKLTAAQRGRKVGTGPYGLAYDRATGAWAIDPVRGPIVREVFERVAGGESCRLIALELEARRVPAPGTRPWVKGRVRDLVRSRHPVGEWIAHHRTRTAVTVPPIVTEELWERAQAGLDHLRTAGLRRTRHVYLLEGLAVCGACGRPIRIRSANTNRRRWRRVAGYRCAGRSGGLCSLPEMPTAVADERAWAAICSIADDPDLPAEIAALRRDRAADTRDWEHDAAGYRAHLARLDQVAAAVLVRFRRGTIAEAELDQELAGLNRERAAVRRQLVAAERARGAVAGDQERLTGATTIVAALRARMAAATPEERREIATTLIDPGGVSFTGRGLRIELFVERPAGTSIVDAASCSDVHESRLRIQVVA